MCGPFLDVFFYCMLFVGTNEGVNLFLGWLKGCDLLQNEIVHALQVLLSVEIDKVHG